MRGQVAAGRRIGGVVVVVVAVEAHVVRRVGTDHDGRVVRPVAAAHAVVLVGAVEPGGGVWRVQLDRAQVVSELVRGDLGGQAVVPAPAVDPRVVRAFVAVTVDRAEPAVDVGLHEEQVLAVDPVVTESLQRGDHVAERRQTGGAELDVEHGHLAGGVGDVPHVPGAAGLLRALVVHVVDLARHGAELGQQRGEPVGALRMQVHELHPVARHAVAVADQGGVGEGCQSGRARRRPLVDNDAAQTGDARIGVRV